jgi:OPT family oligopeptide transporter
MINRERLRFPEGTAAAVTLQSLYSQGHDALLKARALYAAAFVGALTPLLTQLNASKATDATGHATREPLLPDSSAIFDWLPKIHGHGKAYLPSDWNVRLDHSFLLLGAGMMVGMRTALSLVLGGLLLILFLGPRAMDSSWVNPAGDLVAAVTKPGAAWKQIGIWYGAPLMVAYGLATFALQGKMIARAFRRRATESFSADDAEESVSREVEVPMSWFLVGGSLAGVAIIVLAKAYFGIPPLLGALAVVMSFFLTLVAARATGETSITPTGAVGKVMQLTYGVLMPQNTVANLATASITSSAAGAGADLLNELKVGYLLGANPRRQYVAQLFGILSGTLATTIGYFLLVPDASQITGMDGREPRFPAPIAQSWKAVADVFRMGLGNLHPMARTGIAWGLAFGALFALTEALFPRLKKYLPSATGIAFGLMLPFSTPFSFLVGATLAEVAGRLDRVRAERYVIPVASGVIAGESIFGVVCAALNNFFL